MKILYEIKDANQFLNQLAKVAQKYGTRVQEYDEGPGHFIFIKTKIKIYEVLKENRTYAYVWGATEEDISFLNSFWGEPLKKIELQMTPLEFASELLEIPQIEKITIKDIIQMLEISERELNQYIRFIKRASRKTDIPEEVKKANKILECL